MGRDVGIDAVDVAPVVHRVHGGQALDVPADLFPDNFPDDSESVFHTSKYSAGRVQKQRIPTEVGMVAERSLSVDADGQALGGERGNEEFQQARLAASSDTVHGNIVADSPIAEVAQRLILIERTLADDGEIAARDLHFNIVSSDTGHLDSDAVAALIARSLSGSPTTTSALAAIAVLIAAITVRGLDRVCISGVEPHSAVVEGAQWVVSSDAEHLFLLCRGGEYLQ